MLQALAISTLVALPAPAQALEYFPGPAIYAEKLQSVAEDLCPTEYGVAAQMFGANAHPKYTAIWGRPDPSVDTWYWNVFAFVVQTVRPDHPELMRAATWSIVGAELVAIPLRIGQITEEVRDASPEADLTAHGQEIAQLVPMLDALLALETCLLPSDYEIARINADSDNPLYTAVANLECRNWREFSSKIIDAHPGTDIRAYAAEFEKIFQTTVGRCEGDAEQ